MARSTVVIELIEDASRPIFINLAESIIREIERGRLKPGDRLPGTRALAGTLGVHRNTVDAAYQELVLQAWLVSEASRGTFVARDLPDLGARSWAGHAKARAAPIEARTALPPLKFSDGAPDARLMPGAELARAFRRAVSASGLRMLTGYGDPRGAAPLRSALARYLSSERGLIVGADDILVTRGSQMALFLVAGAALRPGEAVAVECPGYPMAWKSFRAAGARVVGAPVDGLGLDIDRLESLLDQDPGIRAIYLTPHHQYPTTVTLGAGRRLRLFDIARRRRLTLIEDDYDHEYRFEGRPVLPMAARAQAEDRIIHIGSVSKLLAPALRIGYATGTFALLERMKDLREAIDRQGDVFLETALAKLIDEGDLGRHARKARKVYEQRRDHLADELTARLGDAVAFDRPAGGLALWVKVHPSINASAWAAAAQGSGLLLTHGGQLCLEEDGQMNAFRLGFASLDDAELRRAVKLLETSRPV
ncbi:PLP-dependent aminotransferase family protein [Brevundimonas naejangsanensis]|uniref:MocR-like pyridoxine biosynthesis transcription factor PdxR n=1 Tax=Brevundimonas naejangsanensis TaxID=588932 RepID=UPI00106CDD79|nr:PLP-dependent aminotransferase family protein [Brevundimonas naejangsanensis]QBQ48325.1 PLP-dependent aminotransferase family protein [Brevundimonas naejangsanensis]